jgi:hypothetical protein
MPTGTRLMLEAEGVVRRIMPDWTKPPERG